MLVVVFSWLLGGFGAVLRVFGEEGDPKNYQNGSKTTQKPRKDDNQQLKYDLAVLFSLKFILTPKNGFPVVQLFISVLHDLGNNFDQFTMNHFSYFFVVCHIMNSYKLIGWY